MTDQKIHNPKIIGKLKLPAESASKALQISASGEVESSTVTNTELGYISGLTSAVQTQLGDKASASDLTTHINDTANPHSVTKTQVGLGNVDNTSDANKPVSTAQGLADTAIYDAAIQRANHTGTQLAATISDFASAAKSAAVSDSITDAITDVAPSQNAVFDALALKIATSARGAANGVASLDASGLVPVTQMPPAALERLVVVADQAARFALTLSTVQNGDTVKQTDTNIMYFVKDDANLDSAAGYEAYTAGTASAVAWGGITGIPAPVSALSGTNTGDQDLSGYVLNTRTVNGHALSADVTVTKSDVSLGNVDNVQQLPMSYLDTDNTLAANSDVKVASQKAIKAYVATAIGASSHSGDIAHTTFAASNNVSSAASVTGLAFAAASVRSFKALVSIAIDATAPLNESYELHGIQTAAGFDMSQVSVGDDSGIVFSITSAGQIQYTSSSLSGFVSNKISFRAQVTDV